MNLSLPKLGILEVMGFITTSWADVSSSTIQNCWVHTVLISPQTLSLVPGSSNKLSLVNDCAQLQKLINDFTGDSQLDSDNYLDIENEVMNNDINFMHSFHFIVK